jgi:hypothetical protein
MITQRHFKGTEPPNQMFQDCLTCLGNMEVVVTKKEVLKDEGDDFDGVIEGMRTSSSGKIMIKLKVHGFREGGHPLFSGEVIEINVETFEKVNNEQSDTPNSNALNEEFNTKINTYAWKHAGG